MSMRIVFTTCIAIGLGLGLAGCIPPTPTPTPSPTATDDSTVGATPSPTPTGTAAPPVVAPTCENLLDSASLDEIAASGFATGSDPGYIDKIRGEGSDYVLFVDFGGILCDVNNGTRVSELYGFSPITPGNAAAQQTALAAQGFISSAHGAGTLFQDTSGQDGVVFAYYFEAGYWWCAVDVARIDEIVAHSPIS